MSRLADYFAVVGYDHEQDRSGQSNGRILQRFPEEDWDNCPFTPGIELFCNPCGWQLYTTKQQPTFFIAALTDIDAERHYCACINFTEDVTKDNRAVVADDDDEMGSRDPELIQSAKVYAPKSLVLVTRMEYFDTFRKCLGLLYTVYTENMEVELETLVGNILGCIQVTPPGTMVVSSIDKLQQQDDYRTHQCKSQSWGKDVHLTEKGGPQVRFSIGAGDRQALQPPLSATIPTSNTVVATFFHELGLSNALRIICAAMTDHKILFHSQSYTRLTEASHALSVLMYPLKYSYVYIPLLPVSLLEVLHTPTPFIAGVHSSVVPESSDILEVIVCDIDGGSIQVPEHLNIPTMPEPLLSRITHSLYQILHPELLTADLAFPQSPPKPSSPEMLDKEIRAVFLRFFAELFFGYRSCLTISRIHPKPFITFHKANFLGHRMLVENEFTTRVLDSMSFMTFVHERGAPYRVCDIFDEVFSSMPETLQIEEETPQRLLHNIRDLAQLLYTNENPGTQPYQQKVPKPPDGVHLRVHQPPFPWLDPKRVQDIIDEGLAKQFLKDKLSHIRPMQPRIVPSGPHITAKHEKGTIIATNVRRLEVLRNCISFIFENKISDARKIFPAVLRALKSRLARLTLVDELSYHVQSNRAMLEHQQFDLVVRLLNCALQNDSSMDENGVAAAILPLATAFCRKLCTGVIQFAYTCVQEHAVWANIQFWEATFYQDVEKQIRLLYLPQYEHGYGLQLMPDVTQTRELARVRGSTPDAKRRSLCHTGSSSALVKTNEISALEIAAEQLRVWPSLGEEKHSELMSNEESTVYSQAIHYANRMVYLRVPLDTSKTLLQPYNELGKGDGASSNITNSIGDSDSADGESGFEEQEVSEVAGAVVKFVTRFVDKVCTESGVTTDHIKSLHQLIPSLVAMHVDTLEAVFRESKLLPPIQKPKILTPTLLPGEEIVMEGLRVYLVADGREEGIGGSVGGPALLPAEGGIFLTTYRLLFKGTPIDPLACEHMVCRSFPISSMCRDKKINVQYMAQIDQHLQEGLQLRSTTFQLLKIAFDEEVTSDDIEALRKLIHKLRGPISVVDTFAFTGYVLAQPSRLDKAKEKNASLKGFAKRTLLKTAKKAGIKTKDSTPKRQKYILPTPPMSRKTLPASMAERGLYEEELAVIDEQDMTAAIQNDSRNVERLAERAYCRDYQRLGFGSLLNITNNPRGRAEPWRLTLVNSTYTVCKSYPAVLVVPNAITDESIRKFSRSHRQYRFPVVTWRHHRTKAVLMRASGFHGKGVMGMLKTHHGHQSNTGSTSTLATPLASNSVTSPPTETTSSSVEQEKYFRAVVSGTPLGECTSLTASLDSLYYFGGYGDYHLLSLLENSSAINSAASSRSSSLSSRKRGFIRALSGLRGSGGERKTPLVANIASSIGFIFDHSMDENHASRSKFRRTRSKRGSRKTKHSAADVRNKSVGRLASNKETPPHGGSRGLSSTSGYGMSPPSRLIGEESLDSNDLEITATAAGFHKASLYVLGEKAHVKGIKLESFPKCDFIPVEYHEVRQVKSSFKKLMRACVPSAPFNDPEKGFFKAVEDSDWLPQLSSILQIAGATVDLLDVQGSSVMLCLEDGWDFSTQVSSVAQVLLDPYYRTIDGLCQLIEKEWLGYGHRFTHRSNQTAANLASGFAPIFLQFLDVVHQIQLQFPMSFEYNPYLLKFLAYHCVSNRFRTFMMDNEFERMEAGWLLEESQRHKQVFSSVTSPGATTAQTISSQYTNGGFPSAGSYSSNQPPMSPNLSPSRHNCHQPSAESSSQPPVGISIWDYIRSIHKQSPVFYNFRYAPPATENEAVLRPYSNVSNMKLWDYYLTEDLAHGPPYDLEVIESEEHREEEDALIDGPISPSLRKVVNGCYDNVDRLLPDSCHYLMKEICKLEHDMCLAHNWKAEWEHLEPPPPEIMQRYPSLTTQACRSHGRTIHKRSTLELLVKGKLLGEAARMFSQPHHFEKFTYTTPAYCDYCSHVLWGLVKTGMQCTECRYNCHEKCAPHVPKNCTTRLRPVSEVHTSNASIAKTSVSETTTNTGDPDTLTNSQVFPQFYAPITEHRTFEGYLFKRGALLKGWKQRWFVLDSMKHQLRYYDSQEDSNCKGFIDLKEVVSVLDIKNPQGLPKRSDENAVFEMKTQKRIYNFQAPNAISASKWIDEIQSCIQ